MIYHIMLQYVEKYDRLMILLYNIISFLYKITIKIYIMLRQVPKMGQLICYYIYRKRKE